MKIALFNPAALLRKRKNRLRRPTSQPGDQACDCNKPDKAEYLIAGMASHEPWPDLLNTVHNNTCPLEHTREADKTGRAHWNVNSTQQTYRPDGIKYNAQLEMYYEQLGLGGDVETDDGW